MDNKKTKAKSTQYIKSAYLVLFFRWLFLVIVILNYWLGGIKNAGTGLFFAILSIAALYNSAVTYDLIKRGKSGKTNAIKYSSAYFYMDSIIISLFCYTTGGIGSDLYILLFFIMGLCGIMGDVSKTVSVSLFCVLSYSIMSVIWGNNFSAEINYWKLIFKDMFIMFAALGISHLDGQIKKFDEMHKREFKLARTDKLTGLANRHYLEQKIQDELEYAEATGMPLNILIFDLDSFKKFNDTYGHVWGDKLLTLFSDIIKQNVRKTDIPVRFGGEEFLILIRELDLSTAKSIGDRIRRQLEKQRIYVGTSDTRKRVTVSCGVAQYPVHSTDIKKVIEYADKALYHAKDIGKNIVVTYDEIGNVQRTDLDDGISL